MTKERSAGITRRQLLRRAGAVGAAAAAGSPGLRASAAGLGFEGTTQDAAAGGETYEHLTAEEAELLEAIADYLIPADEYGPGALEARAVHYIDRALGGALRDSHDAYRVGLAAFDRYCRSSRGGSFTSLDRRDRLSALIDVETGGASWANAGFAGGSGAFFAMVRSHVIEGTFGDPYYGGNANFVGWDLIRYPGVRTAVSPQDQTRLEAGELPNYRRSAYDWETFDRAVVRRRRREGRHGN